MKEIKKFLLLGLLAMTAVFGLAGCRNPAGGGNGGKDEDDGSIDSALVATWHSTQDAANSGESVVFEFTADGRLTGDAFTNGVATVTTSNGRISAILTLNGQSIDGGSADYTVSGTELRFSNPSNSPTNYFRILINLLNVGMAIGGSDCYYKADGEGGDTPSQYTVTYATGEGGGTVPAAQTVNAGTVVHLPGQGGMTAPAGKVFAGWNNGTETFQGGVSYTVTGGVIFTAQWAGSGSSSLPVTIILQAVPGDPSLSDVPLFLDDSISFSVTGYDGASYQWYWNGKAINGADASAYTVTGSEKGPGIYELLVVVTTAKGEKVSARCRVTINKYR
ncbi:MAG: hypothetical protein LBH57_02510 [Treponema sp.]|jgi:hypothetical protein|nr:hypothetical protein [Treponema sp.]